MELSSLRQKYDGLLTAGYSPKEARQLLEQHALSMISGGGGVDRREYQKLFQEGR